MESRHDLSQDHRVFRRSIAGTLGGFGQSSWSPEATEKFAPTSRPPTCCLLPKPQDVDARHKAGHDERVVVQAVDIDPAIRSNVMAGLVPAIHVLARRNKQALLTADQTPLRRYPDLLKRINLFLPVQSQIE